MMSRWTMAALAVFLAPQTLAAEDDGSLITAHHSLHLTEIAGPLEHPWGMDWLPDDRIVVTERPGRIRVVSADGEVSDPLAGLPEITSDFRDGLLDIAVSPNFGSDNTIYFAYSQLENGHRWLTLASAEFNEHSLKNVKPLLESDVRVENDQGFGARIRFAADGSLFLSVGDHASAPHAQDASNTLGSIVRVDPDGKPHPENPFQADDGKHGAIYAYGFKNPQGLAIHPETGEVWTTDHGAVGGAEINRIEAGSNYGWPDRTFGDRKDAPGAPQVNGGDFADPAFTWGVAPTIALSGMTFYTGNDFPAWQGDLFVGSLATEALIRLSLDDSGHVIGTESVITEEIGRIRDVRQGPDGKLYLLNDDPEGGIYRIDPKPSP